MRIGEHHLTVVSQRVVVNADVRSVITGSGLVQRGPRERDCDSHFSGDKPPIGGDEGTGGLERSTPEGFHWTRHRCTWRWGAL